MSIQSSYMSPSVSGCSSTSRNLVSCSLLIFCLCSLIYFSCGNDICGISAFCLPIGIANGAILPFIIFLAITSMFSYSFLTPDLEAPPSSILFFLLRTLGDFAAIFFLFSNVAYMSSLVLLTLVHGFCGLFFW